MSALIVIIATCFKSGGLTLQFDQSALEDVIFDCTVLNKNNITCYY